MLGGWSAAERRERAVMVACHSQSWPHTTLHSPPWHCLGRILELEMQVREDFTITETAPTLAFSWLKESIKTLCQMSIYLW